MSSPDAAGLAEEFARIEELLQRIEQAPEGTVRGQSRALLQSVLRIHAAGLSAMLEILSARPEGSKAVLEAFAQHEVVSQLLLLHGLHPLDLGTRVRNVMDRERAIFERSGVKAELVSVADGAVRIRLEGSAEGVEGMRRALEARLVAEAPDAVSIDIEGIALAPVAWKRGGPA